MIYKDYVHPTGIRLNTGIKYHRITGKTDYKDYYHPDWTIEAAGNHAEDFMRSRIAQSEKFYMKKVNLQLSYRLMMLSFTGTGGMKDLSL